MTEDQKDEIVTTGLMMALLTLCNIGFTFAAYELIGLVYG